MLRPIYWVYEYTTVNGKGEVISSDRAGAVFQLAQEKVNWIYLYPVRQAPGK